MLRSSQFRRPNSPATRRDRESLDFSRFPTTTTPCQPTKGLPYKAMLKIACQLTGRTVSDIASLSKSEILRVKERGQEVK